LPATPTAGELLAAYLRADPAEQVLFVAALEEHLAASNPERHVDVDHVLAAWEESFGALEKVAKAFDLIADAARDIRRKYQARNKQPVPLVQARNAEVRRLRAEGRTPGWIFGHLIRTSPRFSRRPPWTSHWPPGEAAHLRKAQAGSEGLEERTMRWLSSLGSKAMIFTTFSPGWLSATPGEKCACIV
jgi:hypothetical protein